MTTLKRKIFDIILNIFFSLILVLPILGLLGVFPAPTRDLYNTDRAFTFIKVLTDAAYINYMMAAVHVIALLALWTRREAFAALLIAPITANVIGFHLFLDGGLWDGGSIPADIMLALNAYLLWKGRAVYQTLWMRA